MPMGGSVKESLASQRAECLSSIQRRYPTWDIQRAGDGGVTAKRGDDDLRAPSTQAMWVKLAVTERAER
jgi:hypothetical protein